VRETYEFWIDRKPFHARVNSGRARTNQGHAADPDLIVTTDVDTFVGLLSQRLSPREGVENGTVQIQGAQATLERFVGIFAWPAAQPLAAGSGRSSCRGR